MAATCVMSLEENLNEVDVSEFGESNGMADVTLIVEGLRIPVVKAVLAMASPVFQAMFQNEFKEKSATEIYLPGKDADSFIVFLRCIYPNQQETITAKTALLILPLTCEYQVSKLTDACEDRLLKTIRESEKSKTTFENVCKYLKCAETLNRSQLVELCIDVLSEYSVDLIEEAMLFYRISEAIKWNITKLACQRLELFKTDTQLLMTKICDKEKIKQVIQNVRFSRANACFPFSKFDKWDERQEEFTCVKNQLKATRMTYEFDLKYDSTLYFDEKKCSKSHILNCKEFTLLPDVVKQKLKRELESK